MVRVFSGRGTKGSRVLFLLLLFGTLFEVLFFFGLSGVGRADCGRRRRGAWRFCKRDSAGRRTLTTRLIKVAVLYQQKPVLADLPIERGITK
jgi:hypothetical protein